MSRCSPSLDWATSTKTRFPRDQGDPQLVSEAQQEASSQLPSRRTVSQTSKDSGSSGDRFVNPLITFWLSLPARSVMPSDSTLEAKVSWFLCVQLHTDLSFTD